MFVFYFQSIIGNVLEDFRDDYRCATRRFERQSLTLRLELFFNFSDFVQVSPYTGFDFAPLHVLIQHMLQSLYLLFASREPTFPIPDLEPL